MGAIHTDELGRAEIDYSKCVSCGQCLVNCPFGAIADKGQIYQLIQGFNRGDRIYALVAPAFINQFPSLASTGKLKSALKAIGFCDVVEVAIGADLCAIEEAEEFMENVPGKQPFMATSCCPAWSVMAKKLFPELRASQAVEKLWEAIPSRMSLPQLSIGIDIKQRSFAVAAHGLERLRELVRAGRRLHAAADALEPVDDFVHIHALAELRNALRVAAAAADELHIVHLSVFHLEEDLAGAGAPRRIFVCHVLISLSKN